MDERDLQRLLVENEQLKKKNMQLLDQLERDSLYQNRFKNLVDHSMVGIYVIQDERVIYCNPRLAEIYGYTQAEILAWTDVTTAVVPEEREMVERYIDQRLSGEIENAHYVLTIIRKDGEKRILDVFGSRMIHHGKVAIIGSLIDQTEQKRIEAALLQSEDRFRKVFEFSALGIAIADPRTRSIVKVNPAFEKMLGYSEKELQTLGIQGITHPEDWPTTSLNLVEVVNGSQNSFEFEKRYLKKDGSILWGRVVASVGGHQNGVPSFLVSMIEDVTGIKKAREEIHDLLIREQDARIEAQNAVQIRDDFMSIASHELLTPLTPLNLGLNILERYFRGPDEVRVKKALSRIEMIRLFDLMKSQFARLKNMMSDFLDDASLLQSQYLVTRRESVDLTELVKAVVNELSASIKMAGCQLNFSYTGMTDGVWDSKRIMQVVKNLIYNAIKFGARKPIEIEVLGGPAEALLKVSDHGEGISERDQGRIFERFARAVSIKHYGGFGLGLYLSKEIVKAHGGRIEVKSELHKGSTFTVRLPRGI